MIFEQQSGCQPFAGGKLGAEHDALSLQIRYPVYVAVFSDHDYANLGGSSFFIENPEQGILVETMGQLENVWGS